MKKLLRGAMALALALVVPAALSSPAAIGQADPYGSYGDSLSTPATRAVAIVPSDTVPLAEIPKAIYVGQGGTIVTRGRNDTVDSAWVNVPSGALVPYRPRFIRATGTTATSMLALY